MIRIVIALIMFAGTTAVLASEMGAMNREADRGLEFSIRPYFEIPLLSLEVTPYHSGDDADSVTYSPNVQPDLGIALGINGLEISASAPLPSKR